MGVRAGQGFGSKKPKRGICRECNKKGMTTFKALGGTGFLGRHCQFCGHSESVTPQEYMRMRAERLSKTTLTPGVRVKIRSDAVYEDGVAHRFRGVQGSIYKRIGHTDEWIVTLDQRGPICIHHSNLEMAEHG